MRALDAASNQSRSPVEIHPVRDDEIALLEHHLGFDTAAPGKHRERLARQKEGSVVYLVAWLDDLPVGHALLKWHGAVNPELSSIHPCPDIEDLFVSPSLRSRGIGSRLLRAAESLVRQRGGTRIGLAVSVDNPRARALYERRGYRDAGIGTFHERWSSVDADGQTRWWQETCHYLVKTLDETSDRSR